MIGTFHVASEQVCGAAPPCEPGLGRDYWRVWSAVTVSSFGDGVVLAAFPLLAASLTRSPLLVAGAVFALRLPWLVAAPFAGVIADRFSRVRLMQVADFVRATVFAALGVAVLGDAATLVLLYAAGFIAGTADTLHTAATHATLPTLVDEERLSRANGRLLGSMTAVEQVLGPALGGVLFATAVAGPFTLDAATFVVSALVLVPLARRRRETRQPRASTVGEDLRAGLSAFWSNDVLRVLSIVMGGLAFGQAMAVGVLVLFALDVLGMSEAGFGLLLGVSAIGNVAGSLVAERADVRLGAASVLVGAAMLSGAAYLALGLGVTTPLPAVLLLTLEAVAVAVGSVVSLTVRQTAVANEMLGRVSACFRMVMWGALPLGTLAGGLVAASFGLRAALAAAGGLQLAVIAVAAVPLTRTLACRRERTARKRAPRPRAPQGAVAPVKAGA